MGILYLSVKAPLIIEDNVEGVIGLAVNITDRKRAEELEFQNRLNKNAIIIAEQVAHDIRSPLAALSMFTSGCKNLSKNEHVVLQHIAANIRTIADNLLLKYKEDFAVSADTKKVEYIAPYLGLQDVIDQKKCQYKDSNITFNYHSDSSCKFVFLKGNYSDFCRMMSNLLNNSVEAIETKNGIIDVNFAVRDKEVEICVKDNGKGIPQEIIDKIISDIPVASTKESGHGIGMQQIKGALSAMNAKMSIKSENGTEITITTPESEAPPWFASQIVLHNGDHVVVLDDDQSIHDIWKQRLEEYSEDITIKYFTNGQEAVEYIKLQESKDKILLLVDYELRGQEMNGIEAMERSNMQNQTILVTRTYVTSIKGFNENMRVFQMLPKAYINDAILVMEEEKSVLTSYVA